MSAHTPGPWTYFTSNEGWTFNIHHADDTGYLPKSSDVASLYVRTVECDPEGVQEANARLIAAAPELLEAAQIALSIAEGWIHDQLDGTGSLEACLAELKPVRAAIAAATGETT